MEQNRPGLFRAGQAQDGQSDEATPSEALGDIVESPAKLLRIGSMVREMLAEVRRAPLDDQGRARLRDVHQRSIEELKQILSPELRDELDEVAIAFDAGRVPTESELRIAQAQLVGWLEGVFHGIQAALWTQQMQAQQQLGQLRRHTLPGQTETGQYL